MTKHLAIGTDMCLQTLICRRRCLLRLTAISVCRRLASTINRSYIASSCFVEFAYDRSRPLEVYGSKFGQLGACDSCEWGLRYSLLPAVRFLAGAHSYALPGWGTSSQSCRTRTGVRRKTASFAALSRALAAGKSTRYTAGQRQEDLEFC